MTIPDLDLEAVPPEAPLAVDEDEKRRRRRKLLLLLLLGLLLSVFLALSIWYLLFRKPITEIIPPPDNFAMPTFVTAMYDLDKPISVAVTADGSRIYVTQGAGSRETLVLGSQGERLGALAPPDQDGSNPFQMFVAVDQGTGDVYTTDRTAGQVRIYASDGTFKRVLEPPAEVGVWQPLAITVDTAGNVFVADVAPPFTRVHEFTRDGSFVRDFGVQGQLDHPNGLAIDGQGNLYVSSVGNGVVYVFDQSGGQRAVVARGPGEGDVGLPRGVAIDDQGRFYVVESTGQRVQVYRALKDGASGLEYVNLFGTEGIGDGAFAYPNGIAVDGRSRIYIADWGNNRLQLWSY